MKWTWLRNVVTCDQHPYCIESSGRLDISTWTMSEDVSLSHRVGLFAITPLTSRHVCVTRLWHLDGNMNECVGLKPGEEAHRWASQWAGRRFRLHCKHCVWAWTSSIFYQAVTALPGSCALLLWTAQLPALVKLVERRSSFAFNATVWIVGCKKLERSPRACAELCSGMSANWVALVMARHYYIYVHKYISTLCLNVCNVSNCHPPMKSTPRALRWKTGKYNCTIFFIAETAIIFTLKAKTY